MMSPPCLSASVRRMIDHDGAPVGGNAEKNWKRDGVAPTEAEQVFFNTPLVLGDDPVHSGTERRCYALGQTDNGRALFVAFTLRGRQLRVVSARDMSRKERRAYRS